MTPLCILHENLGIYSVRHHKQIIFYLSSAVMNAFFHKAPEPVAYLEDEGLAHGVPFLHDLGLELCNIPVEGGPELTLQNAPYATIQVIKVWTYRSQMLFFSQETMFSAIKP